MPNWLSDVSVLVAESRRSQDLSPKVEDPAALATVAVLLQSAMTATKLTGRPVRPALIPPPTAAPEGCP